MKVFVYGTLKRGFGNHRWMMEAQGKYLKDITIPGAMFSLGGFPAVNIDSYEGTVHGELYEIPDDKIAHLDRLEGHPRFYQRRTLQNADDGNFEVYTMSKESLDRRGAPLVANGVWSK